MTHSTAQRVALLGGTFNPIHHGHLLIAQAALESQGLDRVVFIPSGLPPHKKPPRTSAQDRLAMVRLAVRGNPAFSVSDWEIRRGRIVYTFETVDAFHRRWPRAKLFFIIGSDSLKDLPRWRDSQRLRSMCRFLVIDRIPSFASSDIRRRVRRDRSCRYFVPDSVERYIRARRLYRRPE